MANTAVNFTREQKEENEKKKKEKEYRKNIIEVRDRAYFRIMLNFLIE
jgi:hypothetical protein